MSEVATYQDRAQWMVQQLALPIRPGENVKAQQNKVARLTGLSFPRVRQYWYRLIPKPLAHEYETLKETYKQRVLRKEEELIKELAELQAMENERIALESQFGLDI